MKLAGVVLIAITGGPVCAQTTDGQLAFEVASIKPVGQLAQATGNRGLGRPRVGFSGGPGTSDPGLLSCNRCFVALLVREAYALQSFQLSPSWKDTLGTFDLSARVPKDATKEQVRLMLQNLLAERFKLAIHHEMKEMELYDLAVAKGGPNLKESVEKPIAQDAPEIPRPSATDGRPTFDKDGFAVRPPGPNPPKGAIEVGAGGKARLKADSETMQDLAERLSNTLGKPVRDATGLKGKYAYTLIFELPAALVRPGSVPSAADGNTPLGAATGIDTGTPIESAIQSQLGLKLEQRKGQVEMIVVDHAENPTEN